MSDEEDIVTTLRRNALYIPTSRINSFGRPQIGFELTSFNLIAAAEIERLRSERDEARRMYCEEAFCHRFNERGGEATIIDSRQIAHSMGWDCFKEGSND